ncbi:MAG TPA: flavodoxin domain-containing protein [Thermomicrobiales bacterium]|nr:flavodoxin domain-containing protein [Thermomicrobiales bacterium]
MDSIVIYASRSGNTRKVAEAVAEGLRSRGTARLVPADEAPAAVPAGTDLVVVGGPTEAHGMTAPVGRFFDRLGPGALQGTAAAAFDTRLRGPRWLWGSAAAGIAGRLHRAGARSVAPAESFFVTRAPALEPGEAARAETWAAALADCLAAGASATAGRAG